MLFWKYWYIYIYIYILYILYIYIYIYINTSHGSLCLTNNVFILDQRETITISITSYNLAIFYFIGVFLSSIFYKKDNFNITKQIFPFLIISFSANFLHKSKNCDLKCCPNNFLVLNSSKSQAKLTVQKYLWTLIILH